MMSFTDILLLPIAFLLAMYDRVKEFIFGRDFDCGGGA